MYKAPLRLRERFNDGSKKYHSVSMIFVTESIDLQRNVRVDDLVTDTHYDIDPLAFTLRTKMTTL